LKKLVSVLAISLLLAMVSIVYAQGHGMMGEDSDMDLGLMGRGHGMIGEHHIWGKLMSLGLDEKQKEAVKEILRKTKRETIKRRADLDIAQIDLKDLLDKDAVNMMAVESKLKQIASLESEIHLARIKSHEEIKSKLTPDQRKKLKEMMEQGMMMGKMGMMQGKGCGMMGEMKGGMMKHGNMETVTPSAEKGEEMPGMQHGNQ